MAISSQCSKVMDSTTLQTLAALTCIPCISPKDKEKNYYDDDN